MAVGQGRVLLPLSTAAFYTRPDIAYVHLSDVPPDQFCPAWDAADHMPVAGQS